MTGASLSGLFLCEGTSDEPLADIVEYLFAERDRRLILSRPNLEAFSKIGHDVESKLIAGSQLMDKPFDLAVVHRDADNAGWRARRDEIEQAMTGSEVECGLIPIIPVRMTEAWLLLDEQEIRDVAGNPNGSFNIDLPGINEVERIADPKARLRDCLLQAANVRGRRRRTVSTRFPQHRRQLLERLDKTGPISRLPSWRMLIEDVEACIKIFDHLG